MFLNTTATTHPARKGLDARRTARTVATAAKTALIEQTRRIRAGHVSFVLGLTLAVAGAVSLGTLESGASPSRLRDARPATRIIAVSKAPAAPVYIVLVDSQDEADRLVAEAYYLQTDVWGSVAFPSVRVISSAEDDQQLQDWLAWIGYDGVDYRITDLRAH